MSSKQTDTRLNHVNRSSRGTEASPEGSEEPRDVVAEFVNKELGGDLKRLKNVGELLEKLREENIALEEEVKQLGCDLAA